MCEEKFDLVGLNGARYQKKKKKRKGMFNLSGDQSSSALLRKCFISDRRRRKTECEERDTRMEQR